jgi:hypothetical protein
MKRDAAVECEQALRPLQYLHAVARQKVNGDVGVG